MRNTALWLTEIRRDMVVVTEQEHKVSYSVYLFSNTLFWLIAVRVCAFDAMCLIPVNPAQWLLSLGASILKGTLSEIFPMVTSFYLDGESAPILLLLYFLLYMYGHDSIQLPLWKKIFLLAVPVIIAQKNFMLFNARNELKTRLDIVFPSSNDHPNFFEYIDTPTQINNYWSDTLRELVHSFEEDHLFSFSKSFTNHFQPLEQHPIHDVILFKTFTPRADSHCLPIQYRYSPTEMFSLNRKNLQEGKLYLDLYKPKNQQSDQPTAVVVNVHGGGWKGGDKRLLRATYGGGGFPSMVLNNRITFVSVSYRLLCTGAHGYELVEDIRDALLYLKSHSQELNINPDEIFVVGVSAGAHLSLLTLLRHDIKVNGIISLHGPTETRNNIIHSSASTLYEIISGYVFIYEIQSMCLNSDNDNCVQDMSVVNNVKNCANKECPPMLLIHGQNDPLVPLSQPTQLSNELTRYNVTNVLLDIPCASHNCEMACSSGCSQTVMYAIARFINNNR